MSNPTHSLILRSLAMAGARHVAVALVAFLALGAVGNAAAGIPLYAQDWQARIYNWNTGEMLEPETARLISDHAVTYGENGNRGGDAGLFDFPGGPDLIHYMGLSNLWFGEVPYYLDPTGLAKRTEGCFYHSTNPAALTAWRTAAGVELRWTPDMRYVTRSEYSSLPTASGTIDEYMVERTHAVTGIVAYFPTTSTSYLDTTADPGAEYHYNVLSVAPGSAVKAFSDEPVVVGATVETLPRFWVEKADYHERIYDEHLVGNIDNEVPITWPFRFRVDQDVDPSHVTLEIYNEYDHYTGLETMIPITGFTFDSQTNMLAYDHLTSTQTLTEYGGISYRLRYHNPSTGETVIYPEDRGGRKHFISTAINNRTMGTIWLSYQMNVEGADWLAYYATAAQRLADGVDPTSTGTAVTYDGVFMDSVSALNEYFHNTVRPIEYGGDSAYRTATENFIKHLCANVTLEFYANTGDYSLLETLKTTSGFAGAMDESYLLEENGTGELADLIYLNRSYSGWRNLVMNAFDYAVYLAEREQGVVGYLLAREPVQTPGAERLLYGYGGWKEDHGQEAPPENVNIMPEQLIGFGDVLFDPFASTVWPDAAGWAGVTSSNASIISWFRTNAPGFVQDHAGESYAVAEYELEDGLPGEVNTAMVVWHLGPSEIGTVEFTLADLFPAKAAGGPYYRVLLEGTNARLVDGGLLDTHETAIDDPVTISYQKAALFFSARLKSPEVAPEALHALPTQPGSDPLLEVAVSHWNDQPLAEVRVDGTNLGWPQEIILTDDGQNGDVAAGDGVYSYLGSFPGVGGGTFVLPVVATGNDGLMTYTTVSVDVVSPVAYFVDRTEDEDGNTQVPYQGTPYSSVTIDTDNAGPRDLFVSMLNARSHLFRSATLGFGGGIPLYREVALFVAPGSDPMDLLGVAVADMDSDGDEDLFAASQTSPRLYQMQADGLLHDMSSAWGLQSALLQSTTGAWSDYDRDGDVDLLVGTSDCGTFEPGYGFGWAQDVLLRNDISTASGFTDVSVAAGIQPGYHTNCSTVAWGDINGDGYPDAFVGEASDDNLGPPSGAMIDSRLWVNQGDGTFVNEMPSRIGNHMTLYTASAIWRDMDNDGDLDLELAHHWRREALTFESGFLTNLEFSANGGDYSGSRVFDHDLDGLEDVLLLPKAVDEKPVLLARDSQGDGMTFYDFAGPTGIGMYGKTGGAVAGDFNGDGDIDLFLGRESPKDGNGAFTGDATANLFQSTSSGGVDAPQNHFVALRLTSSSGANNAMAIGAKIVLTVAGQPRVRLVDGGSGRGGQDDPTVVFGLGTSTSVDELAIHWPNGHIQTIPGAQVAIDTVMDIDDDSVFEVVLGSTHGQYEVIPNSGLIDWIFTWETSIWSNPGMDRIVFDTDNMDPNCVSSLTDLTPNSPGVSHTATPTGNGTMVHEIVWRDQPCVAPCTIRFTAYSGINGLTASSSTRATTVNVCVSKIFPNMQ